jgi:hypothetical protein
MVIASIPLRRMLSAELVESRALAAAGEGVTLKTA